MERLVAVLGGVSAFVLLSTVLPHCGGSTTGFTPTDAGSDVTLDVTHDQGTIHLVDGKGGNEGTPPCTGLACKVKDCGGSSTTIEGYVYAPNGKLPLYDVQVFIPNTALTPFPKGIQCDHCGAQVSGDPITTAITDATGHFVLSGAPDGDNIPIVVQLGKWRRQTTIPKVAACSVNTLTDPEMTRLPKNQKEGSLPHIALTTGGCDQMGCMLPKVGIDPEEFGYEADGFNKAVNTYSGGGFSSLPGAQPASDLWGSQTLMNTYDLAIFSCQCEEPTDALYGDPAYGIVTKYLDTGGRIFTTDFMYTWYKFSPDPMLGGGSPSKSNIGIGEIVGGAPGQFGPISLTTSFPKGKALADWLKYVYSGKPLPSGATYTSDMYAQMGEVNPDSLFGNIQSLSSTKTVTWGDAFSAPHVFTVDTPVGTASANQCGRGVHIDAHVDQDGQDSVGCGGTFGFDAGASDGGTGCYPYTCSNTLKPDEAMFAFFFFDLASCIQDDTQPPMPPPVK